LLQAASSCCMQRVCYVLSNPPSLPHKPT
jgi:hypothetical protein